MDAIQLIQKDHREVEALLKAFERAGRDEDEQERIVRTLVRELSLHAAVEEELVYPALREAGVEDDVLGALEEHHATKLTLSELAAMAPGAERLEAKVRVLAAEIRHHVAVEERELLPRLKRTLEPAQLRELGDALVEAKRAAPTRPHPAAPDTPPANVISNALAALLDRARDTLRDAFGALRMLVARAGRQRFNLARLALGRAERRGREVAGEAAQRGLEAVERGRARALEVGQRRAGAALDGVGRRGEQASRTVRQAARKVAKGGARGESHGTMH